MLTISLFTEVIISLSFLVCLCLTPFVVSKKILTCLYDTVKTWIAWSSGGWLLTIFNTKELMFSEYQKVSLNSALQNASSNVHISV